MRVVLLWLMLWCTPSMAFLAWVLWRDSLSV